MPRPRRGPGDLLADQGDLVVFEPLLVEPVGAGDFLEGVDGGLNAFGPGDGDQLDVAVDVANRVAAASV